ncbi:ATP-binding cassette domain-containing protein, partial [Marinobacter sp. C7]|uniref:ATP-binding cassette domain-containing protein n=1 Tax=Marinobacter sp. C7 TaxID=2951363 RepID=UPI002551D944
MSENLITLHEAQLTLGKGSAAVHVLKGMSLEIGRGESVGILGPSGSGKSTLVRTLNGLIPPTSGEIMIDEVDVASCSKDVLRDVRR